MTPSQALGLDELIQRLEAATGPSRELDKAIALAIGWKLAAVRDDICGPEEVWYSPTGKCTGRPPLYSESIDDALTLKRDGDLWIVGSQEDGPFAKLLPGMRDGTYAGSREIIAHGWNCAISLVICILRSLQESIPPSSNN